MYMVLGNISCDLDPKIKGQIMYFLVNVSPLKPLEVATSNFVPGNLFVCFVALRPKSTAMVIARRPVHLTTLFPGQA